MKNVLAIETSGALCCVGLSLDGTRFVLSEHVQKLHNERLLPMLSALAESAGLSRKTLLERLDAVAFGRGPGSFTGVRIAAAAAQAIALAAGVGILRISSSEVLAQGTLTDDPAAAGVITSIRSRRDLHYLAAWRNRSGVPECTLADHLHDRWPGAEFQSAYSDWAVAGETPSWWQGACTTRVSAEGDALITVATRCLARGEAVDAAQGLPVYLEGDSPWRKVGE